MADALIDSQVPAKSGGAGMLKKSFRDCRSSTTFPR